MDIIEVKQLTKRFGGLTAVDHVSFAVGKGEIFGFLGPNGAGKSTTISMLATILTPSEGDATISGFSIRRQRDEVRRSIGLVFQDASLDNRLTAEENLRFHARCTAFRKGDYVRRMEEVLRLVDLWDRRRDIVETFSGGMKRRLEIARGLIHYPDVLFLDEPTIGLDPQTRALLWDYVLKLKHDRAMTIFMTTHYMDEAEYCDRIAIMDHGKIVALDTPGPSQEAARRRHHPRREQPRKTPSNRNWSNATADRFARRAMPSRSKWPTAPDSCPGCLTRCTRRSTRSSCASPPWMTSSSR